MFSMGKLTLMTDECIGGGHIKKERGEERDNGKEKVVRREARARGQRKRLGETSWRQVTKEITKEEKSCIINRRRWRGRGSEEHMHSMGGQLK